MPVISPRRSSTSSSGNLYGTSTSSTTGGSSSSGIGSYRTTPSYLNRASSLSKTSTSAYHPSSLLSKYSPSYSSYSGSYSPSSYTPRPSSRSTSSSVHLSGGASSLGTYRTTPSYLSASSNDSITSSRYGLTKKHKTPDTLRTRKEAEVDIDNSNKNNGAKKPPTGSDQSKRLSGSYSSSSLARLVAISGLEIYEKYSPANYKPNCELSRSSSAVTEANVSAAAAASAVDVDDEAVTNITLERPRSRYSRLYSGGDKEKDDDGKKDTDAVENGTRVHRSSFRERAAAAKLANSSSATSILSSSSSTGDVPTATFTLRGSRPPKSTITRSRCDNDPAAGLKNGTEYVGNNSNNLFNNNKKSEALITTAHHQLKELKLSSSGNALHRDNSNNCISATITVPSSAVKSCNNSENIGIYKSSSNDHIKHSGSGLDITDRSSNVSAQVQPANVAGGGDAIASATLKLVDMPITAKKDPNFLKEECELAHAQVTAKTLDPKPISDNKVKHAGGLNISIFDFGADHNHNFKDRGNIVRKSNYNGINTIISDHSVGTQHSRPAESVVTALATLNSGMRRAGGGNASHQSHTFGLSSPANAHTNSNGTVHKHDIVLGSQASKGGSFAVRGTKQTSVGASVASGSTIGGTSRLSSRQVRPLVHRTIPSTAVAAANAAATSRSEQTYSFTNKLYNCGSGNNNNIINNNNNSSSGGNSNIKNIHFNSSSDKSGFSSGSNNNTGSMQNTLEQEDIKYIDSEDPPALMTTTPTQMLERKQQLGCEQSCCLRKNSNAMTATNFSGGNSVNSKARLRPKSTIICSTNNLVFEKINNYKFTNGTSNSTYAAEAATARRHEFRQSGIDSSSIKASIEKFNSFSEHKRTAVTLRQHGPGGSINNLQHHRHSSDFDQNSGSSGSLLRLGHTNGGSLTRSSYRTASASPAVQNSETSNKANATIQTCASIGSSTPSVRSSIHSSSGSCTNSLPTKTACGRNQEVTLLRTTERASASSLYTTTATALPTPQCVTLTPAGPRQGKHQENVVNGLVDEKKGHNNLVTVSADASFGTDANSIRSTELRSIPPPPPSPTASRYWERDSRTSSSLLSSTSLGSSDIDKPSKVSTNDEKSEGLCGLRNIGNTCFMNSVIQCLSHTHELTKFLRTHNIIRTTPSSKDQQILHEFTKLIRDMWTTSVHSVTPMELKRAVALKHRMYSDYNQQDAQEFLRFFLDALHTALNTGVKGEPLKLDDNLSDNKKADLTWEWYARHENSLIRDLFVGQLKSTLKCTTCGNTSVTFDPFWDLSVPLPSSSRCKLDTCLDLFIREEVLDGDEMPTCAKCQVRRRSTKSFTIQRFPKYLVIHLKRFSETRWSKLSNLVEFPTGERELNMGPYGSNPNSNIYYSLYAISNHMGSTAGGHYVALCKHPISSKWHEFNDNIVSDNLSDHHLISSSAYILFYERS